MGAYTRCAASVHPVSESSGSRLSESDHGSDHGLDVGESVRVTAENIADSAACKDFAVAWDRAQDALRALTPVAPHIEVLTPGLGGGLYDAVAVLALHDIRL